MRVLKDFKQKTNHALHLMFCVQNKQEIPYQKIKIDDDFCIVTFCECFLFMLLLINLWCYLQIVVLTKWHEQGQ